MRIIHFCPDANFITDISKAFEHYYPNQNIFLVFKTYKDREVVDRKLENGFFLELSNDFSWVDSILNGGYIDKIVLHGMIYIYYDLLQYLENKGLLSQCKIFWIFWGYELYFTLGYTGKCSYIDKDNPLVFKLIAPGRLSYYIHSLKGTKLIAKVFNELLGYIDFFCFWSKYDFDLLQYYYPSDIKFKKFSYGALWERKDSAISLIPKNKSIVMINHQASKTGNHCSMFYLINKIDKNNELTKLVPLSYGNERVKKIIMRKGRRLFKDKFYPILELLPQAEYFDIISSCSSAVFGQRRQEAAGNIQALLNLGVKVFLREENSLYSFFKSRGYYIYSVERDLKCIEDLAPLSIKEQQSNMECANSNQLLFDDFMPQLFDE